MRDEGRFCPCRLVPQAGLASVREAEARENSVCENGGTIFLLASVVNRVWLRLPAHRALACPPSFFQLKHCLGN
jgi:hypothetical protein